MALLGRRLACNACQRQNQAKAKTLHKMGVLGSAPAGQSTGAPCMAPGCGFAARLRATRGRWASNAQSQMRCMSSSRELERRIASDGSGSSGAPRPRRRPRTRLGNKSRRQARAEAGRLLVARGLARLAQAGRLRDDRRALAVGADDELVRRGLAEGHEGRGEGDHGHEGAEDLHFWRERAVIGAWIQVAVRPRERGLTPRFRPGGTTRLPMSHGSTTVACQQRMAWRRAWPKIPLDVRRPLTL